MLYRSLAAVAAVLAVTSVAGTPAAHAQSTAAPRFHGDPNPVTASAPQVIHCGPAPLTERPGAHWELSRLRVAPLEAAFAEAGRAKRSVATLRIRNTTQR